MLSKISEMKHPDSELEEKIGNGTYVVKMRLIKPIPQFLPISGKKIRIYYNGIRRQCTNCYGGHAKQNCRNQKLEWIDQVKRFMDWNPKINKLWYGKWWHIVQKSRSKTSENDKRGRSYGRYQPHSSRPESKPNAWRSGQRRGFQVEG